ncbi:class I SAM-dependent methyltransferase [Algibacter amylolyticus]|uniref:Class I SAM-dependent methyltransferase n=1 Tax=Algibacter amylolyticus TaxID=1608400 RepID=A0A5M7AUM7_9FLAO|nr:RsmD family RNA methyltransferase [Algibacter amylolyticus]KAA5821183.1 class I SAM-dependent methyltransferase [Algibacter amylolyticus]MBB5269830.1 16S rRNA G966 N2-methylase RsmD [Algibacter amylolyticus]TSJ72129.1 class I SAM-dependent methyltransferase [Algibacter amylolyticus]
MNKNILNTDIQNFIENNANIAIGDLVLKGTAFPDVNTKQIIEQIEAKNRCKSKLFTWYSTNKIYYPNKLNIEQTSSETTAEYKSELINGDSIIDLTGGFGVDCFYFSKRFKSVIHCEINESLSDIVNHNYHQLNISNIKTINEDGIAYLETWNKQFDWIYIDPSRRHNSKGKVFFLKDCLPNVPEHLDMLLKHSNNIMIKTSPLLDISVGIGELKHVKRIHVVAVNNEVKELLWVLENGYDSEISIKTVNIKKDKEEHFSFPLHEEKLTESEYSLPLDYLYEPNASILKSGAFNQISKQLEINKLQKHSHLYTSSALIDFPGRIFTIEAYIPYNKKALKRLGIKKANITTRNFPETVQQIRSKFKINDGGNDYLFFTTDMNANKIVLITKKTNL